MAPNSEVLYEVETPVGFRVRVTNERWNLIVKEKHPVMLGEEGRIRSVLEFPDEVRQSRHDTNVYLFYATEKPNRWFCAVARKDDEAGFLITAYPTDAIKEGSRIWPN